MAYTKKQKTALLIVAVVAVLCVAGAVLAVILTHNGSSDKNNPAESAFTDKETGKISGYATDSGSFLVSENKNEVGVIANAQVVFIDTATGIALDTDVTTDENGYFEAIVPIGTYTVTVYADGYAPFEWKEPVTVNAGQKRELDEHISLTRSNDGAFGNVISSRGGIYYWKYSSDSFSAEEATGGYYKYNASAQNELIRRDPNGKETVILTANGAGELCAAGGRIFYQELPADQQYISYYNIKSCAPDGSDVKDHVQGTLLGVINGGKHLIIQERDPYNNGVSGLDTETFTKTLLSKESFLICGDTSVFFCRQENCETNASFEEEEVIFEVNGSGETLRDVRTEKAISLQTIAEIKNSSYPHIDGYITVDTPLIVGNTLFYIYEHIAGSGSYSQSARIMRVDLATLSAAEITGKAERESLDYTEGEIEITDEASRVYNDHLSDPRHIHALDRADYADFSDAVLGEYSVETGVLKTEYCEKVNGKTYALISYGNMAGWDGWRQQYRFVKCALIEKDGKTGKATILFRSDKETSPAPAQEDGAEEQPSAAPLTEADVLALFNKANTFYIGWLEHGPGLVDDYSEAIEQDGMEYLPVKNSEYTTMDQISAAAADMFAEEIYADMIKHLYTMRDGRLYAVIGSGEGGDIGPDRYELQITSQTDNACAFSITVYSGSNSPYTASNTLSLQNGKWIFTNRFTSLWDFDSLVH